MKVEYSRRAVLDLQEIADYHARSDNQALARRIADAIRSVVDRISMRPEAGRPMIQRPGVRIASLPRYRYNIFYRATGDTLRILHIRHTSRRPWADR